MRGTFTEPIRVSLVLPVLEGLSVGQWSSICTYHFLTVSHWATPGVGGVLSVTSFNFRKGAS